MPATFPLRPGLVLGLPLAVLPLRAEERPDFLGSNIDASTRPGDDFFQHANGAWLRRHPIPLSESAWGLSNLVREELYTTLRRIHEKAAETQAPAGSDEQKIGDFWRAAMDVEAVSRLGIGPLRSQLERIDAVKSLPQLLDAAFALQTIGASPFFALFVRQDHLDSRIFSLYAWQGGL